VLACVALTFDDGPGDYTAALLDGLAARGVHATFFVLGSQVVKYPDVVARMAAEGHTIGNHSWLHPKLTNLSVEEAGWQIDATTDAVQQITGTAPTLVRPPYGASNDTVLAVLAARGDASILWSVDTEDWRNRDAGITTQRALATAPGAIILMHDIHPSTIQAVPGIIDQLQAAGYTLVTVPELLGPTTPGQVYRSR
jgi:peptidoglycan/xylan/chitin deacetylase (PgdA/CDA1 family)